MNRLGAWTALAGSLLVGFAWMLWLHWLIWVIGAGAVVLGFSMMDRRRG